MERFEAMLDPEIIYEGKDFLVVNKPSGLMVHGVHIKEGGGRKGQKQEATLVDWLVARYPEMRTVGDDPALRPGIVHRLDKDTSGVMVVARSQASFEYLKSLFQQHAILKTYLALVAGVPKKASGTIDAPIGIVTGSTKRSVRSKKMSKDAVTEYKVLKSFPLRPPTDGAVSLLEVTPKTGRTHQIRVHLASIGHPVLNDPLYAPRKKPAPRGRLMLHAFAIELTDQAGKRVRFEAAPPSEMRPE